jgi:hypothetical protein
MQKARRHPDKSGLRPLVGARFQELFHSPVWVLFTFPSRYLFTIGLSGVFSLTGWSPQIQTGFLVSRPTQDTTRIIIFTCTGLSPSLVDFPVSFHFKLFLHIVVLQPHIDRNQYGLGCSPFDRHYLGITIVFFSSAYLDVSVQRVGLLSDTRSSTWWVIPFGNLRIKSYLHFPAAYRSLSRPSSPLRA